jgi:hypothetical protein
MTQQVFLVSCLGRNLNCLEEVGLGRVPESTYLLLVGEGFPYPIAYSHNQSSKGENVHGWNAIMANKAEQEVVEA